MTYREVVWYILRILVRHMIRDLEKVSTNAWEDYCEARKDINDLRRLMNEKVNLDE